MNSRSKQESLRRSHPKGKPGHNRTREVLRVNWDADVLYRDVLNKYVVSNCQSYPWYDKVAGFIRQSDWKRLYDWADSSSAVAWTSVDEHFHVNQLAALVLKYPFDPSQLGFDPEKTAMDKFLGAEERCRKTNKRFAALRTGRKTAFAQILEWMRLYISRILGDFSYREMYEKCGFGTGASIGVHGNRTNIHRKMSAKSLTGTPTSVPFFTAALNCHPQLALYYLEPDLSKIGCFDPDRLRDIVQSKWRRVDHNTVSFVPKTTKTFRSIAVEPLMNGFLQKGVEHVLKERLLAVGVDLRDQSKNQYLAKVGSVSGEYSTLDLSSASDTISLGLCRYLLPVEWFNYLDAIRSPSFIYKGEERRYEKFASMGNGFSFPLESLIFHACVKAARRFGPWQSAKGHATYGDDLIIASEAAPLLVKILQFCGFVPNQHKSFLSGPFRESCGADWYDGQDVRPVYLDYRLADVSDLMVFHNVSYRGSRTEIAFSEIRDLLRKQVSRPLLRPRQHGRFYARAVRSKEELKDLNGSFDVSYDDARASCWAVWNKDQQRYSWCELRARPVLDLDDSSIHWEYSQYLAYLLGGQLAVRRKVQRNVVRI